MAEQELRDRDAREQEKAKLSNETEKFALQGQLSKQRDQIILKVTNSLFVFKSVMFFFAVLNRLNIFIAEQSGHRRLGRRCPIRRESGRRGEKGPIIATILESISKILYDNDN